MEFQLWEAVVAGLAGTAVMTVLMYMGSAMGMRMDMPMMLGTMVFPAGAAARAAGFVMHFMAGAVFFVIYALLFDGAGLAEALVGWGALFGVAHGVMAGVMLAPMPNMHPRMAASVQGAGVAELPPPGLFAHNVATMAPVALIGLHAVYGGVAGAIYQALA